MSRLRLDIDALPKCSVVGKSACERALYLNGSSLALKLDMTKKPVRPSFSLDDTHIFAAVHVACFIFCPIRKAVAVHEVSHEREDASGCGYAPGGNTL